jgi:hypothetical protein
MADTLKIREQLASSEFHVQWESHTPEVAQPNTRILDTETDNETVSVRRVSSGSNVDAVVWRIRPVAIEGNVLETDSSNKDG